MKGSSALLLLALSASATLVFADNRPPGDFYPGDKPIWPVPTECPEIDSNDYTVHLANEQDCTKFYKCLQGTKIPMECPVADANGNKLHFNRILQVCDWPERAMCQDNAWTTWRPSSIPSPTPPPPPPSTRPPSTTPSSTEQTTTTPSTTTPTTPSTTPKIVHPLCQGKRDGDKIPNNYYCYFYYQCQDGQLEFQDCSGGLQFYPGRQTCDVPDGSCWVRNPTCSATGVTYIPHECCNRVYVCMNGKLSTARCAEGWRWDNDRKRCASPTEVTCNSTDC